MFPTNETINKKYKNINKSINFKNEIINKIYNCSDCIKIVKHRNNFNPNHKGGILPKGNIKADLFFIGLAPGRDKQAIKDGNIFAFEHKSGNLLMETLNFLDLTEKSYISNIVKCITPKEGFDENEVFHCVKKFLLNELKIINPKKVILLGGQVEKWYLNHFKDYCKNNNIKVYKIYHPSYITTYNPSKKDDWIKKIKWIDNN